jgi:putative ABC transport system permease protein
MWLVSLRDLQWRRRRFVMAVISASLVFSLTLVLDGLMAHIIDEASAVVDRFGATGWVVADGKAGPFTATKLLPSSVVDDVKALPGVGRADAMVAARETVHDTWINVIGYTEGGLGAPTGAMSGRLPKGPGEALADELLGVPVGGTVTLGGNAFRVVGTASGLSYNFGAPTVMLPIAEVQRAYFGGQPLVGAVAVRGTPRAAPAGLQVMSNEQVSADLRVGMQSALQTIGILNVLLWIIAAAIIASIVYLSALERVRDFAVMKAIGVSNRSILAGLACASLLLAVLAGIGATLLALLLGPSFPMPVDTPPSSYLTLLVVALVVGVIASLAGFRRAARVDPALAFGGA